MSDLEAAQAHVQYFNKNILDLIKEMKKSDSQNKYEYNFYRVGSKSCPFSIDFSRNNGKFERRNKVFTKGV